MIAPGLDRVERSPERHLLLRLPAANVAEDTLHPEALPKCVLLRIVLSVFVVSARELPQELGECRIRVGLHADGVPVLAGPHLLDHPHAFGWEIRVECVRGPRKVHGLGHLHLDLAVISGMVGTGAGPLSLHMLHRRLAWHPAPARMRTSLAAVPRAL